jgi:hypothetical protein
MLVAVDQAHLNLTNDNFDVGGVTVRGQYKLNDKTCADLLHRLSQEHLTSIDPQLKTQLLAYYATAEPVPTGKVRDKSAETIKQDRKVLEEMPTNSVKSMGLE